MAGPGQNLGALEKEDDKMKRFLISSWLVGAAALAVLTPQTGHATPGEPFRWFGVGGEITTTADEPRRWLGRIGLSEDLGAEVLFAMEHTSGDCKGAATDCDYTRIDVGAGVIYDVAPGSAITPYLASRFILSMTANGDDETSGIIEAAGGAEYAIMSRLGVSAELNLSIRTDPAQILTSTRVRFHFYF